MEAWALEITDVTRHEITTGQHELLTILTASLEVYEPPVVASAHNPDGTVASTPSSRRIIAGTHVSPADAPQRWSLTGQVSTPLVSPDGYGQTMPEWILGVVLLKAADRGAPPGTSADKLADGASAKKSKATTAAAAALSQDSTNNKARYLHGVLQTRVTLRPETTLTLAVAALQAVHASALATAKLTLTGTILRHHAPAGYVPVIHRRWYTVKANIRRCSYFQPIPIPPAGQEKPRADDPPEPPPRCLRAGETAEITAVSRCGEFVRWADGREGPMVELEPYARRFAPGRAEKVVRIRRFPHRNADVIGTVPQGDVREAIGVAVDPVEQESYVHWATGGWTRLLGTGGPFLVEQRGVAIVLFRPPKLFTPARDGKGVRIRAEPHLQAKQLGMMEPNEIREAVAMHTDAHGNEFVEWKPSSALPLPTPASLAAEAAPTKQRTGGGFTCCRGLHGQFLTEIVPMTVTLRQTPLRSRRPPPSPEILSLDRPGAAAANGGRKRSRESSRTRHHHDDEDEDDDSEESGSDDGRRRRRRGDGAVAGRGIDPKLVPPGVREALDNGTLSANRLPRVRLDYEDEEDDEDDDSDYDDDDDDDEESDDDDDYSDDDDDDSSE